MSKKVCLLIGLLTTLFLWSAVLQAKDKFTVVIDPGHGGKDPGAKGALINEKVINLSVALKLGEMITSGYEDVNVVYTRKTDCFVELNERANIANRNKADLFISIHANSLKKGNAVQGTETYTLGLAKTEENLEVAMLENSVILLEDNYLQRYGGFDPNSTESYIIFEFMQNKHMEQSVLLASEIQKSFSSINRINRGVRQAGFLVLKATSMPGVLVELGFISNHDEERYMRSAEGQKQLATSIYNAFSKYKKEYSRKQGRYADENTVISSQIKNTSSGTTRLNESSESHDKGVNTPVISSKSSGAPDGKIIYKIQILSSDRSLPATSPVFKGYKVNCYKDGNLYKYTYGESADLKRIQQIYKEVTRDFKDAFIIRMKDGQRLK